ncbi:hypothetical protein Tco_1349250 [Tanacetum coccineum]
MPIWLGLKNAEQTYQKGYDVHLAMRMMPFALGIYHDVLDLSVEKEEPVEDLCKCLPEDSEKKEAGASKLEKGLSQTPSSNKKICECKRSARSDTRNATLAIRVLTPFNPTVIRRHPMMRKNEGTKLREKGA